MRFKENPFCHEQKIFKTTNRGFINKNTNENGTEPAQSGPWPLGLLVGSTRKTTKPLQFPGFVTLGYSTKTGVVMGPWNDNQRQALLRLALVRIPRSPRGKVPLLNAVVGSG